MNLQAEEMDSHCYTLTTSLTLRSLSFPYVWFRTLELYVVRLARSFVKNKDKRTLRLTPTRRYGLIVFVCISGGHVYIYCCFLRLFPILDFL